MAAKPETAPSPSQSSAQERAAAAHDLDAIREVIALEAQGLAALRDTVDESFLKALDLIVETRGRVIVSGMGKSGHIAHKLAATLASTGTPALFVHPAEASHGDLGMITRDDSVLAISNSGETAELSDIVAHTRRYGLPLIAITANRNSALAKSSDLVLVLPEATEACPMGLAPTTSTTMTLALGDALAIALLKRRRFNDADFRLLHPGGQLGRALLRAGDIMHTGLEVPTVAPDDTMDQVLLVMTAKHFGCAGVVEDGRLAGIITDGDLRRHMAPDLLQTPAARIMTREPVTVSPDMLAAEALAILNDRAITALFVVDNGRVAGILHIHDILAAGIA